MLQPAFVSFAGYKLYGYIAEDRFVYSKSYIKQYIYYGKARFHLKRAF